MIFDGHGDIWTDITQRMTLYGEHDVFRKRHLKKFKEGRVKGGIFVTWIDPPYESNPAGRMKTIIECMKDEMNHASDIINIVRKHEDFGSAPGKIDVVNGMEGMSGICGDLEQIDILYDEIGIRHAMLTWNEQNELATGWPQDVNRGITDLGKAAVRKMQDMGIAMDTAHLNDKGFWDMIDMTSRPIMSSHSNVRAIAPHMRNLSDEMIKAIAETGGVIGMNSHKGLISEEASEQTVERLVDHIDYISELVGVDYVGLGFDFNDYLGAETLSAYTTHLDVPGGRGIESAAQADNVLAILEKRGYSEEEIEKIACGNFYRVFKDCWK